MLDSIMIEYRKLRNRLIETVSETDNIIYSEARFYDLGYMQTRVKRIQKELKSVESSLTSSIRNEKGTSDVNTYRKDLAKRRDLLTFDLIYTMSNSFANLDDCRRLAKGYDFKFMICVEGLEEYNRGNKKRAFELIEEYYREFGSVEDHFLINKVFGILLCEKNKYDKAIPFIQYALEYMPDDEELLRALRNCFDKTGMNRQGEIIAEVTELLGYQEDLR